MIATTANRPLADSALSSVSRQSQGIGRPCPGGLLREGLLREGLLQEGILQEGPLQEGLLEEGLLQEGLLH